LARFAWRAFLFGGFMRDLPDLDKINLSFVKNEVKRVWRECRQVGEDVKMHELYEEISQCYGFHDWNCFSAYLKAKEDLQ
jgi:hypothetical protein